MSFVENARSKFATATNAFALLRRGRLRLFAGAVLRTLGLNYQGYYYYIRYLYKKHILSEQKTTEPLSVIRVDPQSVHYFPRASIDKWNHIGEVWDGDWDRTDRTVENSIKYRSVRDRFENNTPWEDTEIYREAIKRINNGEMFWNGCPTINEIKNRTKDVDDLYDSIQRDGFKSQSQIHNKSIKDILLSGSFDRSQTDVAVAIGRNGEILFVDGHHRIAIAHILDIDKIPVRVVVRHAKWEQIRERVNSESTTYNFDGEVGINLDHSDL